MPDRGIGEILVELEVSKFHIILLFDSRYVSPIYGGDAYSSLVPLKSIKQTCYE